MNLNARPVVVVEDNAGDQLAVITFNPESLTLPGKPNCVVLGHYPGADTLRFPDDNPGHPCNAPAS